MDPIRGARSVARMVGDAFREDPVGATIMTLGIVVDVADTLLSPGPDATLVAAGINGTRMVAREAGERAATETGEAAIERSAPPRPSRGPGSVPRSERDPRRTWSPSERAAQRKAQGSQCGNGCGTRIDETNSRGHHVTRHADGGRTDQTNHAEVCVNCHREIQSLE